LRRWRERIGAPVRNSTLFTNGRERLVALGALRGAGEKFS
jgi:hypothetical protein